MGHIFISYSKQDHVYARKLADKLLAEGFDVWIDNRSISSGDDWWHVILDAIRNCSAFVVIMTPNSDESRWVQREITIADDLGKPTFPLLLNGSTNLLESHNWSIYVRTQYSDVRDSNLPDASFYNRLAEHGPRQTKPGTEIVNGLADQIDSPIPPTTTKPAQQSWTLSAGFNRGCYVRLAIVASMTLAILIGISTLSLQTEQNSSSTPTNAVAAVPTLTPTPISTLRPELLSCPDSPPTRLQVGIRGRVQGGNIRLRSEPNTDIEHIEIMQEGTMFVVTDGPFCNQAEAGPLLRFWKIMASGYPTAWIAEGDCSVGESNEATYFLEPIEHIDPQPCT